VLVLGAGVVPGAEAILLLAAHGVRLGDPLGGVTHPLALERAGQVVEGHMAWKEKVPATKRPPKG
jgi:hypothetical protein